MRETLTKSHKVNMLTESFVMKSKYEVGTSWSAGRAIDVSTCINHG